MTMHQLERLKAGGHSFHPVFEVCGKCGIARKRYVKNKKQKCEGIALQFIVIGRSWSPTSVLYEFAQPAKAIFLIRFTI
jgi:hypothetical protein